MSEKAPVLADSDKRMRLVCPVPFCEWESSTFHPINLRHAEKDYNYHRRNHKATAYHNWWTCTCGASVPNGMSHDTRVCGGAAGAEGEGEG